MSVDDAIDRIITAYREKYGTTEGQRRQSFSPQEWPEGPGEFLRVERNDLLILHEPGLTQPQLNILGIAKRGEVFQNLGCQQRLTLINPLGGGVDDNGIWCKVRLIDGREGWLFGQTNDRLRTFAVSVGRTISGSKGQETRPGAIVWILLSAAAVVIFIIASRKASTHKHARALSREAYSHWDAAGTDTCATGRSGGGASEDQGRLVEHGPVGPRNADVYKGSSWWTEEKAGRIDREGNIYKGSSWWTEEKVGRIDREGNIQKGSSWLTEEKAGRIDKEGNIYKGSSWWTEEKVGRIDKEGNIQKGSSWWTEEKAGRVDDKSSGGGSSGSGSSSGCWLTTACMEYAGLPDDCQQLATLRSFRDSYVKSRADGAALIAEYCQFAPLILRAISTRPDKRRLYSLIFKSVTRAVVLIERHDFAGAVKVYSRCFTFLRRRLVQA
jgi:hypothetical protein